MDDKNIVREGNDEMKRETDNQGKKSEEKSVVDKAGKDKVRKIIGVTMIVFGICAILSTIIVPYVIRKNNDKDIEDIRSGKYAKEEVTSNAVEVSQQAVTSSAVEDVTQVSVEAVVEEVSERDKKMEKILKDNSKMGIIEIEKLDVLYAIVEGTEDAQINRAVGHLKESAGIGKKGNCVLAGHRGGYYGTFFERVPELENGDEITLTDLEGNVYTYVVYDKKMIMPTDWSVVEPLDDMKTLTLITCEDETSKRIIVSAVLYEE